MGDPESWGKYGLKVRNRLLQSAGAYECRYCYVITQGGRAGLNAHIACCHPEVNNGTQE